MSVKKSAQVVVRNRQDFVCRRLPTNKRFDSLRFAALRWSALVCVRLRLILFPLSCSVPISVSVYSLRLSGESGFPALGALCAFAARPVE